MLLIILSISDLVEGQGFHVNYGKIVVGNANICKHNRVQDQLGFQIECHFPFFLLQPVKQPFYSNKRLFTL